MGVQTAAALAGAGLAGWYKTIDQPRCGNQRALRVLGEPSLFDAVCFEKDVLFELAPDPVLPAVQRRSGTWSSTTDVGFHHRPGGRETQTCRIADIELVCAGFWNSDLRSGRLRTEY